MPGLWEINESGFIYKRDFVSNPEKYMEVYEESYQNKIKKEEQEKEKNNKAKNHKTE